MGSGIRSAAELTRENSRLKGVRLPNSTRKKSERGSSRMWGRGCPKGQKGGTCGGERWLPGQGRWDTKPIEYFQTVNAQLVGGKKKLTTRIVRRCRILGG